MNAFIKLLMDEHGINQKELAVILGISPSAVSQWTDCSTMSVENLLKLSKLFQVTVDELVNEKYAAETPKHRWDRLYNLEGYEWDKLVEENDKESMAQYLEKLNNINLRFYKLLYKKIRGKANALELDELSNLEIYFQANQCQSVYFDNKPFPPKHFSQYASEKEIWITEILKESVGIENEGAMLWELKRIYQNEKMITFEQVHETQDDDLFYVWYKALTQESKDTLLTNWYYQKVDNSFLYDLIKRGGRILYSNWFPITINRTELERFEGEKEPLEKLNAVKKILSNKYCDYGRLTYSQYQAIINRSAIEKIEMEHKYKEKNPIRYWEFIKQGRI